MSTNTLTLVQPEKPMYLHLEGLVKDRQLCAEITADVELQSITGEDIEHSLDAE